MSAKYHLMPCERQNQKGFGRKAVVETRENGTLVLFSYLRKIAKIVPDGKGGGVLVRLCDRGKEKYQGKMKSLNDSPTVMRHLVAFCVHNGLEPITKKAWNAMPKARD